MSKDGKKEYDSFSLDMFDSNKKPEKLEKKINENTSKDNKKLPKKEKGVVR